MEQVFVMRMPGGAEFTLAGGVWSGTDERVVGHLNSACNPALVASLERGYVPDANFLAFSKGMDLTGASPVRMPPSPGPELV
jgi:hypothetical protein